MNKEKTDNFTGISERILQAIDYLDISPNKFGEILGYERSQTVYDIINKKSRPSFDFFFKFINSEFSEIISVEWLVAGKGEMRKENGHDPCNGDEHNKNRSREDRLLSIIESQQRSIEYLSKKGGPTTEDATNECVRKTS